jgi:hypothetical protein
MQHLISTRQSHSLHFRTYQLDLFSTSGRLEFALICRMKSSKQSRQIDSLPRFPIRIISHPPKDAAETDERILARGNGG